jgi:hypothetical protein
MTDIKKIKLATFFGQPVYLEATEEAIKKYKLEERAVNFERYAFQSKLEEFEQLPIVAEFLEVTPFWLEAVAKIEKLSGEASCVICGIKPNSIRQLHEALKNFLWPKK